MGLNLLMNNTNQQKNGIELSVMKSILNEACQKEELSFLLYIAEHGLNFRDVTKQDENIKTTGRNERITV